MRYDSADFVPFLKMFKVTKYHLDKGKRALWIALQEELNAYDISIVPNGVSSMTVGVDNYAHRIELTHTPMTQQWLIAYELRLRLAPCIMFLCFTEWGKATIYQKTELAGNTKIDWLKVQQTEDALSHGG